MDTNDKMSAEHEVNSQADGSEDFFIRQDEFLIYIEDHANPARVKAGLAPIGPSEARACFRIIEDFRERWNNPPNAKNEVQDGI